MADLDDEDIRELAMQSIPTNTKSWIDTISLALRTQALGPLAVQGKRLQKTPDLTKEPAKTQYRRLRILLVQLEYLPMTPEIKARTRINESMQMFNNPIYHLPEDDGEKARTLLEMWESERWKAEQELESIQSTEERFDRVAVPRRRKSSNVQQQEQEEAVPINRTLLYPPRDHEIWGENGIMHGLARKKGGRKNVSLDERYQQRRSDVYGHNGLRVGDWFPRQLSALFYGAHGSSQGGIYHGRTEGGAYSIVISSLYDDLDRDLGDRVLYSGSGSHENTDPNYPAPSTKGTLSLEASYGSGNPVRVLRKGGSAWAPLVGLRYDGLYQVVDKRYPTNTKGGKYEQFELVRLDGQPEIDRSRPTPQEIRDYDRIEEPYG